MIINCKDIFYLVFVHSYIQYSVVSATIAKNTEF